MTSLLKRFLDWLLGWVGVTAMIQLALLWFTLSSFTRGLLSVVERLPTVELYGIVFLGIVLVWLLGRTKLPDWAGGLLALAGGLLGVVLVVGRLNRPLVSWIATLGSPLSQIFHLSSPNFNRSTAAWNSFLTIAASIMARLNTWINGVIHGHRIVDPLVTGLIWAMLLWILVVWAAWWAQRRNNVMVGLMPSMAVLADNIHFTRINSAMMWLVLTVGGTILLQALSAYIKSDRRWTDRRLDRVEIEFGLAFTAVFLTCAILIAGMSIPTLSFTRLKNDLNGIFNNHKDVLAESLGLQQTPIVVNQVVRRAGSTSNGLSLSTSHIVGPGPHLSQTVMLYVKVDGYIPPLPPSYARFTNAAPPDVRYFWRVQTYDAYSGRAWYDTVSRTEKIPANSPYLPKLTALAATDKVVTQHIEIVRPQSGALFSAGEILSTDQPSVASWRAQADLIYAQTLADQFTVVSRFPYVTEGQMRAAGNNYPPEISKRYLKLPDNVSQRVRNLALDLTADQSTPYDQAKAIESYLRQFPYTLDVGGSPSDREVADYFLFTLKKGYCDYFASTMVILSRAAGLPARLVTGYAGGYYDYQANRFVLVEADAHAWVEIYFPDIGWVEFEPTPSYSAFPRPGGVSSPDGYSSLAPSLDLPNSTAKTGLTHAEFRSGLIVAALALVGLAILLMVLPIESWLLYLSPADRAVDTIFHRLYRQGRAWGVHSRADRTPHEFASALAAPLTRFSKNERLASLTASVIADVNWLTDLYARKLFSSHALTRDDHRQAVGAWARIRRRLRKLR
jgi:transglutaminase-like putative cysteine protease